MEKLFKQYLLLVSYEKLKTLYLYSTRPTTTKRDKVKTLYLYTTRPTTTKRDKVVT